MKTLFSIIMIATVAAAAPATNRVAGVTPAARVQIIRGEPVAKSMLKTQPAKALRVKDSDNKTRDLPIMFDNNRLKKIKEKKGLKENEKSGQGFIR